MAPEILVASPPDILAPAGLPLTLDCLATGHPKPENTWFKNDGQLVESGRISILTNGSLYFHELRESDRAGFKCVVVNMLGSMKSALVNVTVAGTSVCLTFVLCMNISMYITRGGAVIADDPPPH